MMKRARKKSLKIALLIGVADILTLFLCLALINTGDTPRTNLTPENSQWSMAWSDEFNGTNGTLPNPHIWTADVGGGGWGNEQLEYDTNNQNTYQNGKGQLVLEARKNSSPNYQCWYGTCQYTSAHITTSNNFSFTYGYAEARIKLPPGQGLWPTFWMIGTNVATVGWPTSGEIDIMENIGSEPATVHGTVHGPPGYGIGGPYTLPSGSLSDNYHIYGVEWSPEQIQFFIDGINYFTVDKATVETRGIWVFDHPFYLRLNLAVGGTLPGTPPAATVFPQQMLVDYVRVYSAKPDYS